MADRVCWVLKWREDGEYKSCSWWSADRNRAYEFRSLFDARRERAECGWTREQVAIMRLTRRAKTSANPPQVKAERPRVDPAEARHAVEAYVAAIVARHAERDRATGNEEVRDG